MLADTRSPAPPSDHRNDPRLQVERQRRLEQFWNAIDGAPSRIPDGSWARGGQ